MAKYEIEINDNLHLIRLINGEPYLETSNEFIRLKPIPAKPEFKFDRAQVLREEWYPERIHPIAYKFGCFAITKENAIIEFVTENPPAYEGYVFAPTYELAEEIVKIRKGEWIPQKDDKIFVLPKDKNKKYYFEGWQTFVGEYNAAYHYFHSEKQRTAFIEREKAKEPRNERSKEFRIKLENDIWQSLKCHIDENGFLKVK